MTSTLLIGEDAAVSEWAFKTFNLYKTPVNRAIGIISPNGKIIGAILWQNYNGSNVELSYYGPKTWTLGILRTIMKITAVYFNASRLTAVTSKRNKKLMRGMIKLGWKLEGVQRCYYGDRDITRNTGVRFVMFRDRINYIARLPAKKDVNVI